MTVLAYTLGVLLFVVGVAASIGLHEAGHLVPGKLFNVKVTQFFIGFGRTLWSRQRGETEYGVKLIWLGAYVKIIGMNNLEEVPAADESRTYRQQSYPKRVLVAFAGPAMNLVFALVLMFTLFAAIGVERDAFPKLGVLDEGAAATAGIQSGDEIVSIDGEPISEFSDMPPALAEHAGEPVEVVVERDGEIVWIPGLWCGPIDARVTGARELRMEALSRAVESC